MTLEKADNLKRQILGLFRSIIADLMKDHEVGNWFRESPSMAPNWKNMSRSKLQKSLVLQQSLKILLWENGAFSGSKTVNSRIQASG